MPQLLGQVREAVRTRHHGLRTEEAYHRAPPVYAHVLNRGGRGVKSPLDED